MRIDLCMLHTCRFVRKRIMFEERLSTLYDSLLSGKSISYASVEKILIEKFEANHERLLHLSIIRKLFSERAPCPSPVEKNQSNQVASSDARPTAVDDTARADLCQSLLDKDVFFSNMVRCLICDEQLVSFAASRALVAVMGRRQLPVHLDGSKLENLMNDILNMVDVESLCKKRSIYCLQLFTNLLKQLRKPLASDHPALLRSLGILKYHWPKILASFQTSSRTIRQPSVRACSLQQPSLTTTTTNPQPRSPFDDKEFGLSLGEFLSLTVEILRYTEVGLQAENLNSLLIPIYFEVVQSLCALTYLTGVCQANRLYLLKRVLDVFVKINYFSLQKSLDFEKSHCSIPHPLEPTKSQPLHSHIVTQSPTSIDSESVPHVIETPSLFSSSPQFTEPPATSSSLPPLSSTQSVSLIVPQPSADSNTQEQILHESLHCLLRNLALVECFRFWMTKFTKIAGVDVYVEEAAPLIEDGLKCTVTRKACLLLLEYVTSIIVRELKSHLSVQLLLHLESLLQTIVAWAKNSVPPSLAATLEGLLQDDVESPGVDFLRLLFYSILTEQDDCLVRALMASANVHNSLYKEYDSITVDIPLLHLSLGVFNIHTLFVKFLSGAGFDSTLLLDFVMSSETRFSYFLVRYLEIVIREKENSVIFNYDLPCACAELDIVDEYMSMDLSGSEDDENEEMGHFVEELAERGVVDSQLSNVQQEHCISVSGEKSYGENSAVAENISHKKFESETCFGIKALPTASRKRDQISPGDVEFPNAKRAKCNQHVLLSPECDSTSDPDSKAFTQPDLASIDLVRMPEPITVSSVSQANQDLSSSEIVYGRSQPIVDFQRDPSIESDDPPPTQTLVRVLNCLVELGETLARLCSKKLLSMRENNVERIVFLTEQLTHIFNAHIFEH